MSTRTGEAWRRQKELEEERKAGRAPAEVDEEGNEINPHIPQYMANAPWYLNTDHPTLKHQKDWREKEADGKDWYERGVKTFQATKYRKGACENCGAMSHKTKDCVERPRAKGAKWTNKHIAADEKIHDNLVANYDSKRDRWNGYDASQYKKVVERYDKLENLRKTNKRKEHADDEEDDHKERDGSSSAIESTDSDGVSGAEDDTKLAEDEDAAFGEVKKRVRTTAGGSTGSVRDLRIREDTAKYLLNLDLDSAYYDPKSRSMRADPNPDKPAHEKTFIGDNASRLTGDIVNFNQIVLHSFQAIDQGAVDAHMQANPSLAETMYRRFKERKEKLTTHTQDNLLSKYGNMAKPMPDDLRRVAGSERYAEYDNLGRVVRGVDTICAKSKYDEDVCINNHSSVWGSWWSEGQWGYSCCHSTIRNSYCIGKAGGEGGRGEGGIAGSNNTSAGLLLDSAGVPEISAEEAERRAIAELKRRAESKLNDYKYAADDTWGSNKPSRDLDSEKVLAAVKRLEEKEKAALAVEGLGGKAG
eukprot:CAMPEP_0175042336 /NCGR_PEP_ID=MMETSP0052_2-20121109/2500_1 /TAXON_ID=51329 ORGANISM="Polytomella parva, Strain SAG 63-3" /NCGR_SAMPLE_ID=MMETSP0052_2 /ASSEMBLY_ACC=CAM_ASM_000194 /LENGTH=529 /DNA_ID=CAMNT_0016305123 /DNA_START=67 /DNA_END=1653 /DNA_ORIENTATION=+